MPRAFWSTSEEAIHKTKDSGSEKRAQTNDRARSACSSAVQADAHVRRLNRTCFFFRFVDMQCRNLTENSFLRTVTGVASTVRCLSLCFCPLNVTLELHQEDNDQSPYNKPKRLKSQSRRLNRKMCMLQTDQVLRASKPFRICEFLGVDCTMLQRELKDRTLFPIKRRKTLRGLVDKWDYMQELEISKQSTDTRKGLAMQGTRKG